MASELRQRISMLYGAPADSNRINDRFADTRATGIYTGGWLYWSGNTLKLTPFVCEIAPAIPPIEGRPVMNPLQVKVNSFLNDDGTDTNIGDYTVGEIPVGITHRVAIRWDYNTSKTNVAKIITTTKSDDDDVWYDSNSVPQHHNDINIGEATITSDNQGNIHRSIDYQWRHYPKTPEFFSKVIHITDNSVVSTGNGEITLRVYQGQVNTEFGVLRHPFVDFVLYEGEFYIYLRLVPFGDSAYYEVRQARMEKDHQLEYEPHPDDVMLASVVVGNGDVIELKDLRGFVSSKMTSRYVDDKIDAVSTVVNDLVLRRITPLLFDGTVVNKASKIPTIIPTINSNVSNVAPYKGTLFFTENTEPSTKTVVQNEYTLFHNYLRYNSIELGNGLVVKFGTYAFPFRSKSNIYYRPVYSEEIDSWFEKDGSGNPKYIASNGGAGTDRRAAHHTLILYSRATSEQESNNGWRRFSLYFEDFDSGTSFENTCLAVFANIDLNDIPFTTHDMDAPPYINRYDKDHIEFSLDRPSSQDQNVFFHWLAIGY